MPTKRRRGSSVVEQRTENPRVVSSILTLGTKKALIHSVLFYYSFYTETSIFIVVASFFQARIHTQSSFDRFVIESLTQTFGSSIRIALK